MEYRIETGIAQLRALAVWTLITSVAVGSPIAYRDEWNPPTFAWALQLLAFVMLCTAERLAGPQRSESPGRSGSPTIGVVILATLPIWGTGDSIGVALAALALGAVGLRGRAAFFGSASSRFGGVLVSIALMELVYPELFWLHGAIGEARILTWAANAFGLASGVTDSGFWLEGRRGPICVASSWDRMGLPVMSLALAGILGARASGLHRPTPRGWMIVMATMLSAMVVKTILVTAISVDLDDPALLTRVSPSLVALIPGFWVLGSTGRRRPEEIRRTPDVAFVTLLLGAIAIALSWRWHGASIEKPGRIVIDEAHSEWAWSDESFGTSEFGNRSTYNYSSLVDLLGEYFDSVSWNRSTVTDAALEDCDVLVLKMPTEPYEPSEVDAIHRFVRRGGGLWLIGDHTDLFGSSRSLNAVAGRFGMRFRYDALKDLVPHSRQILHEKSLNRHPTTFGLRETLMATSCSLEIERGVCAALVGDTLFADAIDYGHEYGFGDIRLDWTEPFGSFVQGAAVRIGHGRVVAFTDSTVLSNFSLYFPGKWELAVQTVRWLNFENGRDAALIRTLCFAFGVFFVVVAVRRFGVGPLPTLVSCVVAILVADAGCEAVDRMRYRFPARTESRQMVAFVPDSGDYTLPLRQRTAATDSDNFHTFFVWMQRVGCVPRVFPTLRAAVAGGADCICLIRPRSLVARQRTTLVRYVEAGGKVLVLEDDPSGGPVLGDFDLRVTPRRESLVIDLVDIVESRTRELVAGAGASIQGGDPFLRTNEGLVIGASRSRGAGSIAALGVVDAFAVNAYGTVAVAPSKAQWLLAKLQFHVVTEVLGLNNCRGAVDHEIADDDRAEIPADR